MVLIEFLPTVYLVSSFHIGDNTFYLVLDFLSSYSSLWKEIVHSVDLLLLSPNNSSFIFQTLV